MVRRMLKKTVRQGRRRVETGGVPLGYVEDFDEPRTLPADFWGILLGKIILSPTATSHILHNSRTCDIRSVAVTHKRKDSSCASLSPVW
jgi:hypothetical protein